MAAWNDGLHPKRSIRLRAETFAALKKAAKPHGSIDRLLHAMFVGDQNGAADQNPDMEYSTERYVDQGRAGGGISESMRNAILERQRLDPDAPHLIVGMIENTPREFTVERDEYEP